MRTQSHSEQVYFDDARLLVTNRRLFAKREGQSWEIEKISNPRIDRHNAPSGLGKLFRKYVLSDIRTEWGSFHVTINYDGAAVSPISTAYRVGYSNAERRCKLDEGTTKFFEAWLQTIDPFLNNKAPFDVPEATTIIDSMGAQNDEVVSWCLEFGDPIPFSNFRIPSSWNNCSNLRIVSPSAYSIQNKYLLRITAAISAAIAER